MGQYLQATNYKIFISSLNDGIWFSMLTILWGIAHPFIKGYCKTQPQQKSLATKPEPAGQCLHCKSRACYMYMYVDIPSSRRMEINEESERMKWTRYHVMAFFASYTKIEN